MPHLILIFSVLLFGSFSIGGISVLIPGFDNNHISFLLPFLFCIFFLDIHVLFKTVLLLCCGLMIVLYDLMVGGFADFYSFSAACFMVILLILKRSHFYNAYQSRFLPSYLVFSFVLALICVIQYLGASVINNLNIPIRLVVHDTALNIVLFPIIYALTNIAQNPKIEPRGIE